MNPFELDAFHRGQSKQSSANRQLWSQLFSPSSPNEYFGKSRMDFQELTEWLGQWRERLSWLKREEAKKQAQNKYKRRRTDFEEEADDNEDQDFQPVGEHLNNPVIIEGPSGSGKTTMV